MVALGALEAATYLYDPRANNPKRKWVTPNLRGELIHRWKRRGTSHPLIPTIRMT
jgi:hypothetical protein